MSLFSCYSNVDIPRDLINYDKRELERMYVGFVSEYSPESSKALCESLVSKCSIGNTKTLLALGHYGLLNPLVTVANKRNLLQMYLVIAKVRDHNSYLVYKSKILKVLLKYAMVLKTKRRFGFSKNVDMSEVVRFSQIVVQIIEDLANYNTYRDLVAEGKQMGVRRLCEASKAVKNKLMKKGVKFTIDSQNTAYHTNESMVTTGGSGDMIVVKTIQDKLQDLRKEISEIEGNIERRGLLQSDSAAEEGVISELIGALSLSEFKAQNLIQESVDTEQMEHYEEIMTQLYCIKRLINTLKAKLCISLDPTYLRLQESEIPEEDEEVNRILSGQSNLATLSENSAEGVEDQEENESGSTAMFDESRSLIESEDMEQVQEESEENNYVIRDLNFSEFIGVENRKLRESIVSSVEELMEGSFGLNPKTLHSPTVQKLSYSGSMSPKQLLQEELKQEDEEGLSPNESVDEEERYLNEQEKYLKEKVKYLNEEKNMDEKQESFKNQDDKHLEDEEEVVDYEEEFPEDENESMDDDEYLSERHEGYEKEEEYLQEKEKLIHDEESFDDEEYSEEEEEEAEKKEVAVEVETVKELKFEGSDKKEEQAGLLNGKLEDVLDQSTSLQESSSLPEPSKTTDSPPVETSAPPSKPVKRVFEDPWPGMRFEVTDRERSWQGEAGGWRLLKKEQASIKTFQRKYPREKEKKPEVKFEEKVKEIKVEDFLLDDKGSAEEELPDTILENIQKLKKREEEKGDEIKDLYEDMSYVMNTLKRINQYLESKPPKFVSDSKKYQSMRSSSMSSSDLFNRDFFKERESRWERRAESEGERELEEVKLRKELEEKEKRLKEKLYGNIDDKLYERIASIYLPKKNLSHSKTLLPFDNPMLTSSIASGYESSKTKTHTSSHKTYSAPKGSEHRPEYAGHKNEKYTSDYASPRNILAFSEYGRDRGNSPHSSEHKANKTSEYLPDYTSCNYREYVSEYSTPRSEFGLSYYKGLGAGRLERNDQEKDEKGICTHNKKNKLVFKKGIPSEELRKKVLRMTRMELEEDVEYEPSELSGKSKEKTKVTKLKAFSKAKNEEDKEEEEEILKIKMKYPEINRDELVSEEEEEESAQATEYEEEWVKEDYGVKESKKEYKEQEGAGYPEMDADSAENAEEEEVTETEVEEESVEAESGEESVESESKVKKEKEKRNKSKRELDYDEMSREEFKERKTGEEEEYSEKSYGNYHPRSYWDQKYHDRNYGRRSYREREVRRGEYRGRKGREKYYPERRHHYREPRHYRPARGRRYEDQYYGRADYDYPRDAYDRRRTEQYDYERNEYERENYNRRRPQEYEYDREEHVRREGGYSQTYYVVEPYSSSEGYARGRRYSAQETESLQETNPEFSFERPNENSNRRVVEVNESSSMDKESVKKDKFEDNEKENWKYVKTGENKGNRDQEEERETDYAKNNDDSREYYGDGGSRDFYGTSNASREYYENNKSTEKEDEYTQRTTFRNTFRNRSATMTTEREEYQEEEDYRKENEESTLTNSNQVKKVIKGGGELIYEDQMITVNYKYTPSFHPGNSSYEDGENTYYMTTENILTFENNSVFTYLLSFDYSNFENFPIDLRFLNKTFKGVEMLPGKTLAHRFRAHCYGPFVGLPKVVVSAQIDAHSARELQVYLPIAVSCFFTPNMEFFRLSKSYFNSDKFKHIMRNKVYFNTLKRMQLAQLMEIVTGFARFKLLQQADNCYYLASSFSAPLYAGSQELYRYTIFAMVEVTNTHYHVHVSSDSYRLANSTSILLKYIIQN